MSMFEELMEDESLGVVSDVQGGRPLLVAFGGWARRIGMPPFEFVRLTHGLDADIVFVRDVRQAFYLLGVPGLGRTFPEMAETLAPWVAGATRSVFLGNSTGGFAAMVLGSLCAASRVVVFSPLTTMDPPWRSRPTSKRPEVLESLGPGEQAGFMDAREVIAAHPVPIDIHFGARHRSDRRHARRMKGLPGVMLHPQSGVDHMLIRSLRDSGDLRRIIETALLAP